MPETSKTMLQRRPANQLDTRPYDASLTDQMAFAKAMATAGMLPKAYQGNPGNVLLAMEYARALALPVAAIFTSVHVIEGKPSMSAEMMQALVRRAGHRIRLKGDDQQATVAITRKDDPEFTYTATFSMEDAKRAGLLGRQGSNWAKYPAAMLLARATSACARQACADVLNGVSYVPEELGATDFVDAAVSYVANDAPAPSPEPESPEQPSWDDEQVSEWQGYLDEAVQTRDLDRINSLGKRAADADMHQLREDAISAWHRTKDLLDSEDA